MKYTVVLSKTAAKGFRKLPKEFQEKCRNVLAQLAEEPEMGKKLVGVLSHYRSVRLANYRIVYEIRKTEVVIFVVSIRHRKEVYRILSY